MLGLFAVAYGLNNKLDLLDQKGIGERIREWGRSCPLLKRDTIFGVLGAEVELFGGDIRGRISASNNENMSLEAQVTFLLGAIQRLDKELGDLSSQQRKDFFEIKDELKQIEASLADEIKSVASRSAKAHVGDIGWELAGLGWVLIGITLATVPEFIHYWFGWLIELFEVLN